ncbi:hypothetical protein CH35J_006417 [Colletotrichum higginsianum]|uniref:Uncharacterized protein n=1 Tax=Colletotrichum higginsianum TaxID=80884 RepID=A0A4T0W4V7_9PEZI|nr:hypothetical protein CH35J_006417 [Colletotrichum higginsianum]
MKLSTSVLALWLLPWLAVAVHGCSDDNCAPATPTGSGYTLNIPASYENCAFDLVTGGEFQLLLPNVFSIVNNDGKAVQATNLSAPVEPFIFSHPAGAPAGLFDIVLKSGGKTLYLAVYKSGAAGFVDTSSNGQTYIGTGDQYVTTIWSVDCDGLVVSGILSGESFQFFVNHNGDIVASSSTAPSKSRRGLPVPKGFYIQAEAVETPPGTQCSSPVQHATTKNPPVPVSSNGCGVKGFWGHFVPELDFGEACRFHDVCWPDCSQNFTTCNTEFLNRMNAKCNDKYKPGIGRKVCLKLAKFYHSTVSGKKGAETFTKMTQKFCDCTCDDPNLTTCQDQCVDTRTDPKNCGSCNFNCPSGSCVNGTCSFNSCAGQKCGSFGSCGPGGACVCASVTGGTGFCVNGNTPCSLLSSCDDNGNCPLGEVCAVDTCCGRNVCIRTDSCGGFNLPGSRLFAPPVTTQRGDATIGYLAEDN